MRCLVFFKPTLRGQHMKCGAGLFIWHLLWIGDMMNSPLSASCGVGGRFSVRHRSCVKLGLGPWARHVDLLVSYLASSSSEQVL